MANTSPTFFRRFRVFAAFQASKKSKILEPVQITLGFCGPVDPQSGMILNLVEIDAWIETFKIFIAKKTYRNRWEFCRSTQKKLTQVINTTEFSELRFSFHDLSLDYFGASVFISWDRQSLVQSGKFRWRSPVKLTVKQNTTAWPPVTQSGLAKIEKSLSSVNLEKINWKFSNLEFSTFDFIHPKLDTKIRLDRRSLDRGHKI